MDELNINSYQDWTESTAIYPRASSGETPAVVYTTLGLVGEAGEIANKVKKILRDHADELSEDLASDLATELGDVMWYVARLASELGYPLSQVLRNNHDKLESRKSRNTLGGSGDLR